MKLDFSNVNLDNIGNYEQKALDAFATLMNKDGEGNDFLGWIDRPVDYDKELKKLQQKSEKTLMCLFLLVLADPTLVSRL